MVRRNIIRINEDLCNGCGQCITSCAEGALALIGGKAKVIKESYCDGLGACIGECPENALTLEERETDEFDEEAVNEHLVAMKAGANRETSAAHESHDSEFCCPSARPETFEKKPIEGGASDETEFESQLGHWPVQLMLVPETAPFLKGKELVVLADCSAVAYANLHKKFLRDKAIVMSCPKFDNIQIYHQKLKGMIQNSGISGISVVHMEVPCCFGLKKVVSDALRESGSNIPFYSYIIGIKGNIIEENRISPPFL